MHRIDSVGATIDNQFTEGNPATGTPATRVAATWLNAVQEELAAVIEGAGLVLNKPNNAQLLEAIQALATGAVGAQLADLVRVLDRQTATIDVVNTAVETDLYRFTVPAGLLGISGGLRITLVGDIRNNTGANQQPVLKVKFGGVSVGVTMQALTTNSLRRQFLLDVTLLAKGSADAQTFSGGYRTGLPTTGAAFSAIFEQASLLHSALAEDTAVDKDLAVTVTLPTADANLSFRRLNARLERLP